MDFLTHVWEAGFSNGKFLWITWHFWKTIGLLGNAVFFSRFLVQWYVTEKRKQVVVPVSFWWLSLVGSLLLLSYALYRHDPVFILATAFNWIPYIRNLIIHQRHEDAHLDCPGCGKSCPPHSNYCYGCGTKLLRTVTVKN